MHIFSNHSHFAFNLPVIPYIPLRNYFYQDAVAPPCSLCVAGQLSYYLYSWACGKIRDRTAAFTTFQCCQNANFTSIGQIKGKSGNGVCDFSQNSSFAKLSMLQMTVVNAV
ncbi:hypothetical protein MCOR01_006707 [Pyricularia oryzae]|nr:hypothetical protein MCOR01_006707 [Pyricularia oryzae]